MAKMRAAIRKVAHVTPPPSPKNGDDIKSEWSNRLRNHSTPIANKRFKGKRAKVGRTKKRSPNCNHDDSNGSRSSTPSPIYENTRPRTRRTSSDKQSHCWPRRSARLVGIPAEVDDDQFNKSNGSVKSEGECEGANGPQSPRRRRTSEVANGAHHPPIGKDEGQCKTCNKRKTKARAVDALLKESEHFMHYPSRRTNGCHAARQNCNSHDMRPLNETSPSPQPTPVLPASVDQVQFSFEIVPSGTSWYQTFLRDERSSSVLAEEPHSAAPFLLPYEMTLEAILKSNRSESSKKPKGRPPKGSKKAVNQTFRPIISTRLQMQSAAKLAAEEAAASKATDGDSSVVNQKQRKDRKRWFMPRKSPRCHASTMAILCSKSTDLTEPVPEEPEAASPEGESQADKDEPEDEARKLRDGDLIQALQNMLVSDLQKDRKPEAGRKRGRPRKKHQSVGKPKVLERHQPESSLAELLATPLERMEDMMDERLLAGTDASSAGAAVDDDDDPILEWVKDGSPELPEVFHDLESNSGSRSSSVYETASEIGSTSTGTCESSQLRKAWKTSRRKRRNMTGWPRSKKRKPVPLSIDLDDENLCLTSDGGPPSLSPIREEPSTTDEGSEAEEPPPPLQPSSSRSSYVSKPFQFQRKTLRFVGKRILRPAAQRHAPQRLEYWPCFTVTSSSPPRPRPLPRKRR